MAVSHPQAGVLVLIKTSKSQFLKLVDHVLLCIFAGRVILGKADDTRTIAPLVRANVDQIGHGCGVTPQNLWQRITCDLHRISRFIADKIAVFVIGQNRCGRQIVYRPSTPAFSVGKEFDEHHRTSRCASMISANRRSMPTNAAATRKVSICDAWPERTAVFSHRDT